MREGGKSLSSDSCALDTRPRATHKGSCCTVGSAALSAANSLPIAVVPTQCTPVQTQQAPTKPVTSSPAEPRSAKVARSNSTTDALSALHSLTRFVDALSVRLPAIQVAL
jgi:hypothetical protein